jgi:hypothetical protein
VPGFFEIECKIKEPLIETIFAELQGEAAMRRVARLFSMGLILVMFGVVSIAAAAYHHAGDAENDAQFFLDVYPDAAGTKLDSCALCHGGGDYTDPSTGKTTTMGSCQYCHAVTDYGNQTDQYAATLNSFGQSYRAAGRDEAALEAIEPLDSDADGYSNQAEILAVRYPGDANDDPTKVTAPFRIFDKSQLETMPQHTQFMLMNTTKSGDYYAEYSGVRMEFLLKAVGVRPDATEITVFAADGYSVSHPLKDSQSNIGASYSPYAIGVYPPAIYYYDAVADKANGGWCDYSSPGNAGRVNGEPIGVENGLRMLLALRADGADLIPGYLDSTNKLAKGTEGPFRTVTPQKLVGPPDQPSNNTDPSKIWPFDAAGDHNAGFSSKSATIIKVGPLPEGTTDIDVLEAGWNYVDSGKIVIYGNIDPQPNIIDKLTGLISAIQSMNVDAFKHPQYKRLLDLRIKGVLRLVTRKCYAASLHQLEKEIMPRIEDCGPDHKKCGGNWIVDCDLQQNLRWSIQEIITLLNIVA